jgi:hypothetical protein
MSEQEKAAPRRRRASVGGFRQKLDAPQREGFVRRWVDDSPGRIMEMRDLGYDFAQDHAGSGAKRTDGQGSRISRMGGKRDDGSPHQLVLMETPQSEFDIGRKEKEDALKPFEDALRSGADTTGRLKDQYTPSERSSITHQRT